MSYKTIVYSSVLQLQEDKSYGIGFNYLLESEPLSKPKKKTYKKRKKKLKHKMIESGDRFGMLVVVELAGVNKFQAKVYLCECDCGQTTESTGNNLKSGTSKSCGCFVGENEGRKKAA